MTLIQKNSSFIFVLYYKNILSIKYCNKSEWMNQNRLYCQVCLHMRGNVLLIVNIS